MLHKYSRLETYELAQCLAEEKFVSVWEQPCSASTLLTSSFPSAAFCTF